jgi:uncharacterized protein YneF (UPF0154 family)
MDVAIIVGIFVLGCGIGGIIIWLVMRNKAVALETRLRLTEESKEGLAGGNGQKVSHATVRFLSHSGM